MLTVIDTIQPKLQQLFWMNRDNQQRVVANKSWASNGTMFLNQTALISGIEIQLGTSDSGLNRDDFEALKNHSQTQLGTFSIQFENRTEQVTWDHTNGPAVSGQDLFEQVGGNALVTNVTLKFLTA